MSLAIINVKGLFLAATYTFGSSRPSLNLNQKGLRGRGPNIAQVYGGCQATEPTTIHFTRIANVLFKFRRCLYCITWTEGASPCATINFLEKRNHFQPNQSQTDSGPQGVQSVHQAHGTPVCPQPGSSKGRMAAASSTGPPCSSQKSYREPRSCQKLFPGDFDQLML